MVTRLARQRKKRVDVFFGECLTPRKYK